MVIDGVGSLQQFTGFLLTGNHKPLIDDHPLLGACKHRQRKYRKYMKES